MRNPKPGMQSSAHGHVVHTTFFFGLNSHPNISRISSDALGIILPSIIELVIKYLHIKTILMNQSVQWEHHKGEHCSIIVHTGKMFFVVISLDCSLLPNCSDELEIMKFYTLRMRKSQDAGSWRMTSHIVFLGDWKSQPKPSCWEEPAFWGRGKIRISDYTADYFTSLTCNSRCYYLDPTRISWIIFVWDFCKHRGSLEVWQESNRLFTCLHLNSFGERLPKTLPAWAN